jgi:hypothetical protein
MTVVTLNGGSPLSTDRSQRTQPAGEQAGRYPPITYKIASTRAEREAAFRLVYNRYLASGLCAPNPIGMRVTPYHLLPTTTVFVAIYQGEVIFTLSLIGDGEQGVPMESIFPDEIRGLRAQGVRFGELSCLADRRRELVRFLPVFIQTTRLMFQYSMSQGRDRFVIAVHPKHGRFYERFFGFRRLAGERPYESVLNNPAAAYSLHPFWSSRERQEQYFGQPIPPDELRPRPLSAEEVAYFAPIARPLGAAELLSGGYEMSNPESDTTHNAPGLRAGETILDRPGLP